MIDSPRNPSRIKDGDIAVLNWPDHADHGRVGKVSITSGRETYDFAMGCVVMCVAPANLRHLTSDDRVMYGAG